MKEPGKMKSSLFFTQHIRVTSMVALVTVSMVALFGYSGSKLDEWIGTNHVFLVIGLVLAFPISQIGIYRWIMRSYIPFLKRYDKNHHG